MGTAKKLTEQELAEIKTIRDNTYSAAVELGQIELTRLELNKKRAAIEAFLLTVSEKEIALAKQLEEAYGKGSINLETGEITVEEEISAPVEE